MEASSVASSPVCRSSFSFPSSSAKPTEQVRVETSARQPHVPAVAAAVVAAQGVVCAGGTPLVLYFRQRGGEGPSEPHHCAQCAR